MRRKSIYWAPFALLVALAAAGGAALAAEEVGEVVPAQPLTKSRVEPNYPPAALAARYEAAVIVGVTVRRDGTLGDIEVVESSRPKLGFEDAAVEALEQWAFIPATLDGEPVDSETFVRLNFRVPGTHSNPGAYVASGVLGSTPLRMDRFDPSAFGPRPEFRGEGLPPKLGEGGIPDATGHSNKIAVVKRPPCAEVGCLYNRYTLLPVQQHLAQLPAPID